MKHAAALLLIVSMLLNLYCSNIPDFNSDEKNLPSGSIILNEGYSYALSTTVSMTLSIAEAEEMCFSTDGVNYSEWEPYNNSKDITLPSGHGIKTVYGRFRNSDGITEISEGIITLAEEKITGSDAGGVIFFGGGNWGLTTANVAFNHDGSVMITSCSQVNKVYVYTRSLAGWEEMIIPSPDGGTGFGQSVACTPDAGYIIIGALGGRRVYIFKKNADSYILENTIYAPTADDNQYSVAVSISDDGRRIVAGSWQHLSHGRAFLYARTGEDWSSYGETVFSPPAGDIMYMGLGVKISGDGNTVVVSAPGSYIRRGTLFIYRWNGSGWSGLEYLASDGVDADLLGRHIGISRDGSRIIVGTRCWTNGNHNQGAAYLFEWNGSDYVETHKFMASNGGPDDLFGLSVAMSSDGDTVVIGSPFFQSTTENGRAYVFTNRDSIWIEEAILTASDGAAGEFYGNITAISGNGEVIAVSAPMDNIGSHSAQGSVYLYY